MKAIEFYCKRCGHPTGYTAVVCGNCGARLGALKCPHCAYAGPRTNFVNYVCPECGRHIAGAELGKLEPCSKCGHLLAPGEFICPKCGHVQWVFIAIIGAVSLLILGVAFLLVPLLPEFEQKGFLKGISVCIGSGGALVTLTFVGMALKAKRR
jgi:predicted RNA-binding Zn-ribbon protein involved in translation (DUF1610 family)